MDRVKLEIEGMTCAHCVRAVSGALRGIPGVTVHGVEVGSADVSYRDALATPAEITAALEEEGYSVRSFARES